MVKTLTGESEPPTILVRDTDTGTGDDTTTASDATAPDLHIVSTEPGPAPSPRRARTPTPGRGRRHRPPTPQRGHRTRAPSPQRLVAPMVTVGESDPATALVRPGSLVDLPPGSVVDDLYEIDRKLGAGAMGEVYAARHVRLGKKVAIKVIGPRLSQDAGAIERFAMEAQTLAQIQHPAIVAVDHVGELADGRAYFAMEFLRGRTLHERLQHGRLPLTEAIRVLDQMARGLEAAHAQGVVHRDLKPENTFLVDLAGEEPVVKLVDFGLVKLQADADRRAERTQSGVAIGTPMYMSPEQARGTDVDHRTDIYALGAVAFELLLGQPMFPHARTTPEWYAAHLHESPPLPRSIWPEIPPQLDLVLFAMVAKDPAHRPTLAQVRAVLATAQTTASLSPRAVTEIEFIAPRSRRHAWAIVTIAIAMVALVAGILIGGRGRGSAPPSARPKAAVEVPVVTTAQPPASAPVEVPTLEGSNALPPKAPLKVAPVKARSQVRTAVTDGGVDAYRAPRAEPPPEKKPMDRNIVVDPFAHKRVEVKP